MSIWAGLGGPCPDLDLGEAEQPVFWQATYTIFECSFPFFKTCFVCNFLPMESLWTISLISPDEFREITRLQLLTFVACYVHSDFLA